MTQSDRQELFNALMGLIPADLGSPEQELAEMVAQDVDAIEPIVDAIARRAAESARKELLHA